MLTTAAMQTIARTMCIVRAQQSLLLGDIAVPRVTWASFNGAAYIDVNAHDHQRYLQSGAPIDALKVIAFERITTSDTQNLFFINIISLLQFFSNHSVQLIFSAPETNNNRLRLILLIILVNKSMCKKRLKIM